MTLHRRPLASTQSIGVIPYAIIHKALLVCTLRGSSGCLVKTSAVPFFAKGIKGSSALKLATSTGGNNVQSGTRVILYQAFSMQLPVGEEECPSRLHLAG